MRRLLLGVMLIGFITGCTASSTSDEGNSSTKKCQAGKCQAGKCGGGK